MRNADSRSGTCRSPRAWQEGPAAHAALPAGLPAHCPAALPGSCGIQAHDGHVHALEAGLLVGEVAAGLDRPTDPRVDRLDRVGAHDLADLDVEAQERHELGPRM